MANLITLAEYKALNSISSTTQDAQLNILLPKISQFIKTYCNRTFIDFYDEPTFTTSDGGVQYIYVKECPIVSIISVEYSNDFGRTFTALTEFTDYVLNTTYDRIESTDEFRGFEKALNGYKVTYTGGYEKLPEDIKLAALDLINYYMKSDMSIKSTRNVGSNDTSIEYITTTSLPAHIRRVLDLYRLDLI
jgi:hypothetical protein